MLARPTGKKAIKATTATRTNGPSTSVSGGLISSRKDSRYAFTVKGDQGKAALDRWTARVRRSRLPAFVELQRRIAKHRAAINATLDSRLSNVLIESTNTKIRLLTRIAFGYHSPTPLIALVLLTLGGHTPSLPGRT